MKLIAVAALLTVLPAIARSEPVVRVESGDLVVEFLEDPDTRALCGGVGVLSFVLARPAMVSLAVADRPAAGAVDGGPPRTLDGVALSAGRHHLSITTSPWAGAPLAPMQYRLDVRPDAGPPETLSGPVVGDVVNPAVMRVGHLFVEGVDLLEGHVTRSTDDLKITSRHASLTLTRAYSSAARGKRGLAGAGWSLSLARSIVARPECGLFAVRTGDGGAQTFRASSAAGPFTPQRGYHSSLQRGRDGTFDFRDKADNRYHFAAQADAWGVHRLEYMEEPHGDRVAAHYDARGRLTEIAEVQRVGKGVHIVARRVRLKYISAGGFDRVASAAADDVDLRVQYQYDAVGNLVRVTHHDDEQAKPMVEVYGYTEKDPRDPHQMLHATQTDGSRSEYTYMRAPGRVPGTSADGSTPILAFGSQECVVRAIHRSARESRTISYAYDHSQADRFRAEVTEDGSTTRYLLNADGNPLEMDEAFGVARRVTKQAWDRDHIVKVRETNGGGEAFEYAYDSRGNLISESKSKGAGAPATVTTYAYHPRFNKLTYRKDPDGRVSVWEFDAATGDLLAAEEPDKKRQTYRYDPQGNLIEAIDGEGRSTRYLGHNTYGSATRTIGSDGKTTTTEYDTRGRASEP